MHYCQRCALRTLMSPAADDEASCPTCGSSEPARRLPAFVVTGASGSGKTTVLPLLAAALRGYAVVFDVDWILDSTEAMCDGRPIKWDAFRDTWLSIVHGVAQSGLVCVLLGPFIPAHLDHLPARRWLGGISFLNLDCPDQVRRTRLESRPTWRARDVSDQIAFGRWLRTNMTDQIDTSITTPDIVAQTIADWARYGGVE